MEEIEVGEYVRTKEGYLGVLIATNKQDYNYLTIDCKRKVRKDSSYPDSYLYLKNKDIIKHSKNIIDLIEVGDYVNGKYVKEINQYKDGKSIIALIGIINEEDINSIVTHEQFESIEYKT